MTLPASLKIRRAVPSDVEFLLKTWGRENRRALPRAFPDRLYYQEYQKIMVTLVQRSEARVICAADDSNYIAGFVIAAPAPQAKTMVVHFAYMRAPFRRAGLTRAALEELGYEPDWEIVATHWTPYADRLKEHGANQNLIYNPYVVYHL